jgi:hypothetical protein
MRSMTRLLLAGLAGVSSAAAWAQEPAATSAEPRGDGGWRWYYSAGVPITDLETADLVAGAAGLGVTITDETGEKTVGGQGTLGVMATRNFGVEVRYSASGDARNDVTITNFSASPQRGSAKVSIDGITIYGVARWPVHEKVDLMGKLGYTWQDYELEADLLTASLSADEDDDGIAASVGLHLQMGEHWGIVTEIEYLALDFDDALDEPVRGSISLEYRF